MKKNKKIIIGIILIVLQVLGLLGYALNGELGELFSIQSGDELFEFIGTFLIGIIGIILIIQGKKDSE